MQDKRLVTRLQNYWDLIRRGKAMPEIAQFNPSTIDDLWQNCMKVELNMSQGGGTYSYKYMGGKLVTLFGRDLTGTSVERTVVRYPYIVLIKKLDESVRAKKFMLDENQFVNDKGKVIKYRCCFLPFGTEAKGVTHIIVGLSDNTLG